MKTKTTWPAWLRANFSQTYVSKSKRMSEKEEGEPGLQLEKFRAVPQELMETKDTKAEGTRGPDPLLHCSAGFCPHCSLHTPAPSRLLTSLA